MKRGTDVVLCERPHHAGVEVEKVSTSEGTGLHRYQVQGTRAWFSEKLLRAHGAT